MDIKDLVRKVKQLEIRSNRRTQASLMGQYHSAFKGQGMTFSEVRPYQDGDDIRRFDWNKTARFQEPYVKVMEEERQLTVMLMVDVSASMDYGTFQALKREYVAEIAASIGFSAVGNNDKVGLILYSDTVKKVIPPAGGRKHLLSLLSQILSYPYEPTVSRTSEALQYLMRVFKKRSFVFVFSDFHDPLEEKIFGVASRKNEVLCFRITDSKEKKIPDIGYALLKDSETEQKVWVNTSSKRWRYEYVEAQRKKAKELKELVDRNNAGLIELESGDDYLRPLYRYFQSR